MSVGRLARSVRASEMTVRRDLVVLGDRGLVRRLHGGAILERGKEGYTAPILAEAETNAAMIRRATRVVVVADHSKFSRVTMASFAPIEAAHVLVTDAAAPRSILRAIQRGGVQVVVAGKRGR